MEVALFFASAGWVSYGTFCLWHPGVADACQAGFLYYTYTAFILMTWTFLTVE